MRFNHRGLRGIHRQCRGKSLATNAQIDTNRRSINLCGLCENLCGLCVRILTTELKEEFTESAEERVLATNAQIDTNRRSINLCGLCENLCGLCVRILTTELKEEFTDSAEERVLATNAQIDTNKSLWTLREPLRALRENFNHRGLRVHRAGSRI